MSLFFTGAPSGEAPPRVRPTFGPARAADLRLVRLPGVYAPQYDTHLLLGAVLAGEDLAGVRVLDLGTGTGRLALGAAAAGAAQVTAVDISRRAVLTTRLNAALNRLRVQARRADLLAAVTDRQFDVILANPPYVPGPAGTPGPHSPARAWDAGADGRDLLDRICRGAPALLAPGGSLWVVHSELSRPDRTLDLLADNGLDVEVAARHRVPFGPVLRARADWLRAKGLIEADAETEGLVVIRGRKP